jgi:hypothetical protein
MGKARWKGKKPEHVNRRGSSQGGSRCVEWVHECAPCGGKRAYLDRKTARSAAKGLNDRERVREYRCPTDDRYWHLGHMPSDVKQGIITAKEIYDV